MSRWMCVGWRHLNYISFIPELGRSRKLRYLRFPNAVKKILSLLEHKVTQTGKLLPVFRRSLYLQSENWSHLLYLQPSVSIVYSQWAISRGQLKCDGTRAETRFRLFAKRTSPFKSAEASVQSTTGSRVVRISGSNAGYTMFRGSVKGIGYPLHSPVSPSLPISCVIVCHQVSAGV